MWVEALISGLAVTLAALLVQRAVARRRPAPPAALPPLGRAGILLHAGVLLGVAFLAGSALWAIVATGTLAGWPLLGHVSAGAGVLLLLALLALVRAGDRRLPARTRLSLWVLLVAGTIAGGTMVGSALPWFDTATLRTLITVHAWSGLVMTLAALVHGFQIVTGRRARGVAAAARGS